MRLARTYGTERKLNRQGVLGHTHCAHVFRMLWARLAHHPKAEPEWTLDTLTAAAQQRGIQVARSQVRRIFRQEVVRWRRTRLWANRNDPDGAPTEPKPGPSWLCVKPTCFGEQPWQLCMKTASVTLRCVRRATIL
jgi:hypothetical protein